MFDGLEERATHIHYLTYEVKCRCQGEIQDLEKYQKPKEENYPHIMLVIEEHWQRSELDQNHALGRAEKAQGELEHSLDPTDN